MHQRPTVGFCAVVLLLSIAAHQGYAQDIHAYIYDERGYAIPSPRPYMHREFVNMSFLEPGALRQPEDFLVDKAGNIFIADTGNKRILKLSPDRALLFEIKNKEMPRPMGLFLDEGSGDLFVADAGKNHLLRFDSYGDLIRTYPKPTSAVIGEDFMYSPGSVLVDTRGMIYVIGTGASRGIILMDDEGAFRGFFGANPAPFSLSRWLARLVATEEQKVKLLLQTLLTATDFTIDDQGFVYVVTSAMEQDQIRKLNALGVNTFPPGMYGEQRVVSKNVLKPPELSSIDVNEADIITVLDRMTNKIFQYNQEGDLLFVFGGKGQRADSFWEAKDIASDPNTGLLYVLDAKQGGIHIFEPTTFATLVYQASYLYDKGEYERALEVWLGVLDLDANYPLAHKGVAKALAKLGRKLESRGFLRAAMVHYEYAGDREGYSDAFELRRHLTLRENFGLIILVAAAAIVLLWVLWRHVLPLIGKRGRIPLLQDLSNMFSIITHPLRTLEDIKYDHSNRHFFLSLGLLVCCFAARAVALYATSYHFSTWDPNQINLATELSRFLVPWISWCVSNYLVTLIFDGEGSFAQIFTFSAFSLLPYVLISLVLVLLSHMLSLGEERAYVILEALMYVWMGILFVVGVHRVHDYSLGGAIGISALSVVGVVLVWGATVLIVGLVGSFAAFLVDLAREMRFHV